jgi:hypothetical protein
VRNLRTRRATQIGPAGIKSISGDGHLVGFSSHATNLTPGDANNADDVFVHNLSAHTTTLVSRASGADGALGNNFSDGVALTADGRFVLFTSFATTLTPDDTDGGVFMRQLTR